MNGVKQKLLIGIGNPGEKYRYTRHNVGYLAVETFADSYREKFVKDVRSNALATSFFIEGCKITVVKPLTFVNGSGSTVAAFVNYYGINVSDILVISDDIHLPLGSARLRAQGSSGGHNGLKNIEEKLGTSQYPRLRIGIGSPEGDLSTYVLGMFSLDERIQLDLVIEKTMPILTCWARGSFKEAELLCSGLK